MVVDTSFFILLKLRSHLGDNPARNGISPFSATGFYGDPISGRVYDEYVPDSCFQDEVAAALFFAYTTMRKSKIDSDSGEDGLDALSEWFDDFLMDME